MVDSRKDSSRLSPGRASPVRTILPAIVRCACVPAVAIAMLTSGLIHLSNPYAFLDSLLSYRLINGPLSLVVATCLPILHLLAGVGVVLPVSRKPAFLIATTCFAIYTLAQLYAWYFELGIGCGCFGAADSGVVGAKSIFRAAGSFAAAITGYLWSANVPSAPSDAPLLSFPLRLH